MNRYEVVIHGKDDNGNDKTFSLDDWPKIGEARNAEIEALRIRWNGCTGYINDQGLVHHDGDTCPIHEVTS